MTPWLPLYLILLAAATLSPFETTCGSPEIARAPQLADVLANLGLFVPLGLALGSRSVGFVVLVALALSAAIEAMQLALPRNVSPFDVAANAGGALLGRALAPRLPRIPWTRRRVAAASLGLAAILLAWIAAVRPTIGANDFSNWEPFELWLGNEADGSRPWRGLIEELWVYDRALPAGERPDALKGSPPAWSEGGPVLWMRFGAPAEARTDGPAGPRPIATEPPAAQAMTRTAEGLRMEGGAWRLPESVARHLYDRLRDTSEISVAARVRPKDLSTGGPGRLLTFSRGTGQRNFMLGQRNANVAWRVRTPWAGPNGNAPAVETRDAPLSGELQTWVGSFAGMRGRVEVDARCHEQVFYPSRLRGYPLSIVSATVVAVTALVALGAASLIGRRRSLLAAIGGAGLAWALLAALGAGTHVPGFASMATVLGLAALASSLPLVERLPD